MTNLEAVRALQRCLAKLNQASFDLDVYDMMHRGDSMPDEQVSPEVADLIAQFDVATTAVANRISKLVAKQTGLTAADKAAFQSEIDKLTQMGTDPADPIPTPEP